VGAVCSPELVEGSTAIYLKNALRAKLAYPVLERYHGSGGVYPRHYIVDHAHRHLFHISVAAGRERSVKSNEKLMNVESSSGGL
jgi:hypothetical protein